MRAQADSALAIAAALEGDDRLADLRSDVIDGVVARLDPENELNDLRAARAAASVTDPLPGETP